MLNKNIQRECTGINMKAENGGGLSRKWNQKGMSRRVGLC